MRTPFAVRRPPRRRGETWVAGLDEAGRGAVMGPLVVAGACLPEGEIERLKEKGVRDSKLLSAKKRERLYRSIIRSCDVAWVKAEPHEVDEFVLRGKKFMRLNYLEAMKMAEVAERLQADRLYVDSADILPERFKGQIKGFLKRRSKVFSFHHADSLFPVVSAASIVAKVVRDREVMRLRKRIGDFGSGYPSDPRTISFLRDWVMRYNELPPGTRVSWKTVKNVLQLRLGQDNEPRP